MGSAVIVEAVRTPVGRRYLKRAHGAMNLFGSPARHAAAIAASLIDG